MQSPTCIGGGRPRCSPAAGGNVPACSTRSSSTSARASTQPNGAGAHRPVADGALDHRADPRRTDGVDRDRPAPATSPLFSTSPPGRCRWSRQGTRRAGLLVISRSRHSRSSDVDFRSSSAGFGFLAAAVTLLARALIAASPRSNERLDQIAAYGYVDREHGRRTGTTNRAKSVREGSTASRHRSVTRSRPISRF